MKATWPARLRTYLALGQEDEAARDVLANLPDQVRSRTGDRVGVRTTLELKDQRPPMPRECGGSDITALEAKVAADPKNISRRASIFAMARFGADNKEQAVDNLLDMVRRDRNWNEQAARKQLVKFFEAFGPADPLTISARKRLSSILFS